MQQLTGVDTSFLSMEDARSFGHVTSVSIFDPSTAPGRLSVDSLRSLLQSRLHLLKPFRRRLVEVPFGLDRPYWIDDPDFDLDFHLRELALPPPGNRSQLAEQVSRIVARPLDRSRPLWELYLISGLEGGKVALLAKFHHAAIDGVGGQELMATLLDHTPEPAPVSPPPKFRAERVPGEIEMFWRGMAGLATQPLKLAQFQARLWRTLPAATRLAPTLARTTMPALAASVARAFTPRAWDGQLLHAPGVIAPRTSFNKTIGPNRRWAYDSTPLEDAKTLKRAFGVTVNDVVMATCAGALRNWLINRDELPADPLLAMVPVSVRTDAQKGAFGNQVSAMIVALPTHLADPVERLRAAHDAMKVAKEQFQAIPADVLSDATQFTMPALAARAMRVVGSTRIADVVHPPFNLVISNVPGPQTPLYLAGAKMLDYYPVSAITHGQGLNITVQSYLGRLDWGLLADRDLVPDLWDLMGELCLARDELQEAAAAAVPA